jgi:TonB family protein
MSFFNNSAIKTLMPSAFGIAASIGCHLVFFSTGLSSFASVQTGEKKQDIVPVIELTDAEQARLPDTSSSFNLSSLAKKLNSTNSAATFSNNSNLASIPTPKAEVIVPNKSPSLTFYSNLDMGSNNVSMFPNAPNNYVGAGSSNSKYQDLSKTTGSPRRLNTLPNLGSTTQTVTLERNQNNNNSLFPPPPPNTIKSTPSTNSIPPNSVSNTIGGLQASKFKVTGEETQQNNQNLPENNDKTEAQTEQNTNNTNNNDKPKSIIVSTEEQLRTRQQAFAKIYRQRQQSLSRDETNTTDKEANNNYLAWVTEAQNTKPNRMSIAGSYPQDACLRRLQGNAIYGVTIAKGKASNLKLIQSAGYPILNQQAVTDINNRSFFANLNGSTQITVTFNSDDRVCTGKVVSPKETIETPQVVVPTPEAKPIETPTGETRIEGENKDNLAPTPTTEEDKNN